jgi:PKD repeat protein
MSKYKLITPFVLLVIIFSLASCSRPQEETEDFLAPERDEAMPAVAPGFATGTGVSETNLDDFGDESRMIIHNADMHLIVNDVSVAIDRISELAETFEGYVVNSSRWREGERLAGSIMIRVAAERFNSTLGALRGLAIEVMNETTSSKDVTEEYTDLNAKLNNLEATEQSLLRIMEQAETVTEILAVQRELTNVREDIEVTKGRMQYLERTSESSLIDIRLEQAKLDIEFTANKTRIEEGEEIIFYVDLAGGFPPYSYQWDFGDGSNSNASNPVHKYKSSSDYTVSLTVTDDKGSTDTEIREDYVSVLSGWDAGNIVSSAWNGLKTFGQVLLNALIWVAIFSPVWLAILGFIYWLRRRRKRKSS